jgi:molecular chaperone GrpE
LIKKGAPVLENKAKERHWKECKTEEKKTAAAQKEEPKAEAGKTPDGDRLRKLEEKLQEREEELKKQTEEMNRQTEEMQKQKDLLLRTAAEYDNFRKRTEREKAAIYSDATGAAVLEFLPVADNLTRALEQKECSAEDLRKGVEMVHKQMQDTLDKLGVTETGQEGEPFDPEMHNAVSHVEDEKFGENTITQVFQKGYSIAGKIIRHAMVQVAN